jgi:Mg2+-importing ATPase
VVRDDHRSAALTGGASSNGDAGSWSRVGLDEAARLPFSSALASLATSARGLDEEEARSRLTACGPNALADRKVRPLSTLARQLKNPLLVLLGATAAVSIAVGEHTDAAIILAIVFLSVVLGFINEYRSERAIEDLHARVHHTATVVRGGTSSRTDVSALVPGDIIALEVGDVVPADLRLIDSTGLECDEQVLTGESLPVEKSAEPDPDGRLSCALMGTVVRAGSAMGVVVETGQRTALGGIARRLNADPPITAFQRGLRDFSTLLIRITAILTISIFALNAFFRHPWLESLLFSLAVAVGLTPQLLPAIVTISLSQGARRMAQRDVIVKRLVAIEDFGNVELLFTDKTGTLTQGALSFAAALDVLGSPSDEVFQLGLACSAAGASGPGGAAAGALDAALIRAAATRGMQALRYEAILPFDYERRLMSVVAIVGGGRRLICKGAPESVFERCSDVPRSLAESVGSHFAAGRRVIAVGSRPWSGGASISRDDEAGLTPEGLLVFSDPPKPDAAASLRILKSLGVDVKIATGDNERVAQAICAQIGFEASGAISGAQIEAMDDRELRDAVARTAIFARVNPLQKSRLISVSRAAGKVVGFLGDGVNDAVALHDADVGISVESASDVAKDAADIVLVRKGLGILAGGIIEGRRVFANTIKYVLMATSSNFGNMFSAAGASLFLSFLPMLPSQVLLNNLLYDAGEMTIPTDNVDLQLLRKPAHWDVRFIDRFMLLFGPISSIFDFATFGVMLWLLHAGPTLFRTGWFVESLMTQSLVIFVIRTQHVPFYSSRPSKPLMLTTAACIAVAVALPYSAASAFFGFSPLPILFFIALLAMIATYLGLVELAKVWFYRSAMRTTARPRDSGLLRRIVGRFRRSGARD